MCNVQLKLSIFTGQESVYCICTIYSTLNSKGFFDFVSQFSRISVFWSQNVHLFIFTWVLRNIFMQLGCWCCSSSTQARKNCTFQWNFVRNMDTKTQRIAMQIAQEVKCHCQDLLLGLKYCNKTHWFRCSVPSTLRRAPRWTKCELEVCTIFSTQKYFTVHVKSRKRKVWMLGPQNYVCNYPG